MKKKRIALISAFVAIAILSAVYLGFYAIPSEFGKRPFYNLSVKDIESAKINLCNSNAFVLWSADLSEEETARLAEIMQNIRTNGKTDMKGYTLPKFDGYNNGTEYFSVKLKSGREISIGKDSGDIHGGIFLIDFVRFDSAPKGKNAYKELQSFHDGLLSKKGAYAAINSIT